MLNASKFLRTLAASALVAGTLATLVPALPASAAAVTAATSFSPVPNDAGVAATWTATFTPATTVAAGGTISLTFPNSVTSIPATATWGTGTITQPISSVGGETFTAATAGQVVTLTVVGTSTGVAAMTVTFAIADGIKNPVIPASAASGTYFGSIVTSADTTPANFPAIAIGGAGPASQDTISAATLTPNTPGAIAGISLVGGMVSNLTAGVATITITFAEATNFKATAGYGLPATISKSMISISGTSCDLGTGSFGCAGGQITSTQSPPSDALINLNDGTVSFVVPDMNPGNIVGAGHNLQAGQISIGISPAAGITNPTAASTSKTIFLTDSTEPMPSPAPGTNAGKAPLLPRVLQLNDVEDKRGAVVTVNGFGFSGASVTLFLDNGGGGAVANDDIQGAGEPTLGTAAVSGGKFSTTVTITSAFKAPPAGNWIQGLDQSGTVAAGTLRATATNFKLDPSILSLTPGSGSVGDQITAQLIDYPAGDTIGSIVVGSVILGIGNPNLVSTPAIAADGTATWVFKIPALVNQGPNTVNAKTLTNNATKTLTVNGATIVVSPTSVVPGQQITISGSSFTGSTAIVKAATPYTGISIGGTYMTSTGLVGGVPIPPDTTTDSGGSMIVQFKIPTTGAAAITAPGTYTVIVADNSGNNINGTANITIATPTLIISPTTGLGGSTITFSGTGWAASTSVTVTYPAALPANNVTTTVQSDTSGNITGTMTIPTTSNLAIPSTNTVTGTALAGVETASAVHSVPAATLTVTPTSGAPGTSLTVSGTNFPIFTSLAALTIGGNGIAVTGVNTDASGVFSTTVLIPGLSAGTAAVVATVGGTSANTSIVVTSQPTTVSATVAFAALVNTQNLNIVTSFNYGTGLYQAYVPGLAGNSLVSVGPNTVIFVTMTKDTTIVVSGISFSVKANVPTPLPVGSAVSISVQ